MKKPAGDAQSPKDNELAGRRVAMGVIGAPHGVRGQIKLRSYAEIPQDVTAYGPLSDEAGKVWKITVTGQAGDMLIATVDGITDRNAAESLRNRTLYVPRSALPRTEANEYYHEDLIGLDVATSGGEAYGRITGVYNFGAGNLLAVLRPSGEEMLLPFTRTTFPSVDMEKRLVTILPPDIVED